MDVVTGDRDQFYLGAGTFASRGAVVAGNAINEAAKDVRKKILKLSALESTRQIPYAIEILFSDQESAI